MIDQSAVGADLPSPVDNPQTNQFSFFGPVNSLSIKVTIDRWRERKIIQRKLDCSNLIYYCQI